MNNFQSIRNELFQEVEEIAKRERRDQEMAEFAEELDRQNQLRFVTHYDIQNLVLYEAFEPSLSDATRYFCGGTGCFY